MKAFIIARVSTEEQKTANNSLPAQTARMETYCRQKGFKIVKSFSYDESAYKDQREDFDAIIDEILELQEQIAICFDKVDRLSRNVFDKRVAELYYKALADEIELHFVSDGQVINSHLSAVEKFNFSISLGLAKYYSDAISDNVKRAHEQILRTGRYPGHARYGYKRVSAENGKTEIVADEYELQLVRKAYELYATRNYSFTLLRKKLQEDYNINWSNGYLDQILQDPFYYGMMKWKGKLYPHKYPTAFSKQLYDQVQDVKASFNKKKFKYAGKPYYYRGLIRCADCGLSESPEKHKGHVYYHCTQHNGKHGAAWLREEEITQQLAAVFEHMKVPEAAVNKVLEALRLTHEQKITFREQQAEQLHKEREAFAKKQENLLRILIDGSITTSQYDKFQQEFRDKIAEIDAKLALLQDAEDNYYITAKYILELVNRAPELFARSELEERRQLLNLVFQNLRVKGKKVLYDLRKPFDAILDCADHQSWLLG